MPTGPPRGVRRDCTHPVVKHRHGTVRAYHHDRCRCLPCALAKSRSKQTGIQAEGLLPICGTARRLRALAVIGWSAPALAMRLGVSLGTVEKWRAMSRPTIREDSAKLVAALYDELWCVPRVSSRAWQVSESARHNGWLPPLAWDDETIDYAGEVILTKGPLYTSNDKKPDTSDIDEIAVTEAIHGRKVHLTRAEVTVVVAKLTAWGYSAEEIAERVGTCARTVQRKRSAA